MKIVLSLIFLVFLFSCYSKNETQKKFVHQKSDSIWTTIQYAFDWKRNGYSTVTARKIEKDSLVPALIDKPTGKVLRDSLWIRDTIYLVPVYDTARDEKKKVVLDSLGKPKMMWYWYELIKDALIIDYNRNWK